jgi:hypothetical protein
MAASWSRARAISSRGRLAERAGLHVLAELGDPPVGDRQVDRHRRAAERRALAGGHLRVRQTLGMRDVGREREDALGVELDQVGLAAHSAILGIARHTA